MGEVKELATKLPDIKNSRWAAELEDDNGGMRKVKRRDVPVSIPESNTGVDQVSTPESNTGEGEREDSSNRGHDQRCSMEEGRPCSR
jgi:hypothetical protein